MEIFYNVPLAPHTTFGIGGAARLFIEAGCGEDIVNVLAAYRRRGEPLLILGGGSNLLIGDSGVNAALHIGRGVAKTEADGNTIRAGAGARLSKIALLAQMAGLTGLEWAAHIPGTLGGALCMNAGAYGGDMAAVTEAVRAAVPREGGRPGDIELREYGNAECGFSYRRSVFQDNGGVITGAALRLRPGRAEEIKRLTEEYLAKRRASQPFGARSAGSVFKAAEGVPAARYIDGAGLKGLRIGGAEVSRIHANFIVNAGGATCRDVLGLIDAVMKKVYDTYGVTLEPEIKVINN